MNRPTNQPVKVVQTEIGTCLSCPNCGVRDLEDFRYLEDISTTRLLDSVGSTLRIDSHYDTNDEDEGANKRLLCVNCGGEWLLPAIEIEWVA